MAEIASGNPYEAGGAGSGVGAVMFTPNHKDITDIGADWNKQNAADEAAAAEAEKERVKNLQGLVSDLNPNVNGALDSDADYFRTEVGKIVTGESDLLRAHNGNPTSTEAMLQAQNLKARKLALESEAAQSGQHKALILNETNKLIGDAKNGIYNPDLSAANIAKARTMSVADRQKFINDNGGSLLVENPLNMSKEYANGIGGASGLQPDQTFTKTSIDSTTGLPVYQTDKGFSPQQLELYAVSRYNSDPRSQKSTNAQFKTLAEQQPLIAQSYIDQSAKLNAEAQKNGNPQAMRTPEQLYAINSVVNEHAYSQKAQKQMRESEEQKYQAWVRRQRYKQAHPNALEDDYFYDQGLNTLQGDRNAWGKFQYNPDGTGVAEGSVLDGGTLGKIKVPQYTLKQNAKGDWQQNETGNYEDKDNRIRYTTGIFDKDASGNLYQKSVKYVDDASLLANGINPLDISGDNVKVPSPKDPTKDELIPISEYVKQHPEILKDATRQVLDQVVTASKMKVSRAKFYDNKGAYADKSPSVEKATNVKSEQTAAPAKQTTPAKQAKTISTATLQSKVGTKGFEGYTLQELKDYYTSQGYTVK
jgi:hypothetical protein